jgi:prepilin-type N-terminal cleavage/methylation domain-containing protein
MSFLDRFRQKSADEGFSLIELAVASALMALVMTFVVTTVVRVRRVAVDQRLRGDSLAIASVAMDNMSKALRAATPLDQNSTTTPRLPAFKSAAANDLVFYTSLSGPLRRIHYFVDANRVLWEETTVADAASSPYWTFSASPRLRQIGSKIPTSAGALFTYRTDTGSTVSVPTADPTVLQTIRTIEVNLTIQADSRPKVAPVSLLNQFSLPPYYVVSLS